MPDFSEAAKKKLFAVNADELPVLLLEINHIDLAEPIRVINDTQDLSSNGHDFIALSFKAKLPDDQSQGQPRAILEIDNVGKELMQWLEISKGGAGSTVRMMQVLRSDANTIETDTTLFLSNVSANAMVVRGTLSYHDVLNLPGVVLKHTRDVSPGLY